MKTWVRRIRGAIGMGLAWGFAWFAAGMALLLVVGPDAADVPFPLGFGLLGFLAGATFSVVVAMVEGRRRFHEMSLPRFAGWGAVGGLLFSVIFVSVVIFSEGVSFLSNLLFLAPLFAVAGAGCAAGSLALARMAEDGQRLDAGAEVDEAGLTEAEKRELLGEGS